MPRAIRVYTWTAVDVRLRRILGRKYGNNHFKKGQQQEAIGSNDDAAETDTEYAMREKGR